MSLLFETIQIRQRTILSLDYHNKRLNRSRLELYGISELIDLIDYIRIPDHISESIHKCKVIYSRDLLDISFSEYHPKNIRTLQIVDGSAIDYRYKWTDRAAIERLTKNISADDVIIMKNGFATDASYANLIFFNGTSWITPSAPLLRGAMRERLIHQGVITEQFITAENVFKMKSVKLINAMNDFDTAPEIPIERILR